jgi:hypothetical protein
LLLKLLPLLLLLLEPILRNLTHEQICYPQGTVIVNTL